MIDFLEHQLGPVARLQHRTVGGLLGRPELLLFDGAGDGFGQQFAEVALDVLPDVVDGAALEGRDRHAAVLRAGDVDHRWRLRQLHQPLQHLQAGLARHVVVEGDDIEAALQDLGHADVAGGGVDHVVAGARQRPLDQAGEGMIVVDV